MIVTDLLREGLVHEFAVLDGYKGAGRELFEASGRWEHKSFSELGAQVATG